MFKDIHSKGSSAIRDNLDIAYAHATIYDYDGWKLVEIEDTQERDLVRELYAFVTIFPGLVESDTEIFRTMQPLNDRVSIGCKPLGKCLLAAIKHAETIAFHFSSHRRSPKFDLLQKCMQEAGVSYSDSETIGDSEIIRERVVRLNHLVKLLREQGCSAKFKASCKNFTRGPRKNNRELLKLMQFLASKYRRLLIGRVDLGFRKSGSDRRHSISGVNLRKMRGKLFEFIKKRYKLKFIGFAWSLEYGLRRGFHYHLILTFDGEQLYSDSKIISTIGEYWNKVVTAGEGTYYNCNAQKNSYKNCGIGMYGRTINPEMWPGIEFMCAYVTKGDEFVHLRLEKGMRTFGKSNKRKIAAKRGAKAKGEGLPLRPWPLEGQRLALCKQTQRGRRHKTIA
ncbi:inovirus-type Gp2 protein [Variovorax sp. 2RAF20]